MAQGHGLGTSLTPWMLTHTYCLTGSGRGAVFGEQGQGAGGRWHVDRHEPGPRVRGFLCRGAIRLPRASLCPRF